MKWKEGILFWRRRRGEKKKILLNGNSKKSWHSDKSWKHFLNLPSPIFILFPLLLPTLRPNKVLIWSWRLCSLDIVMTEKKKVWCEYFWHPFMRQLVHSWLSVFHVIYMWGVWFCLHYSTHIYCWECYTPFQSDFIYWVITLERIELKHTFK